MQLADGGDPNKNTTGGLAPVARCVITCSFLQSIGDCLGWRKEMDESTLLDLRAWNTIGIIIPAVTVAVAAKFNFETHSKMSIINPAWRMVRMVSLFVSTAWCIIYSYGIITLATLAGASLALWLPMPTGLQKFIVLHAPKFDILTVASAVIVWLGTWLLL